jgi:hypothetical protein
MNKDPIVGASGKQPTEPARVGHGQCLLIQAHRAVVTDGDDDIGRGVLVQREMESGRSFAPERDWLFQQQHPTRY